MQLWRKSLGVAALAGVTGLAMTGPAYAEVSAETQYVFNTLSFMFHGVLVMWMAAGFAMLESGLVRSKSTASICLKNIALYSIAGIMYYLVGSTTPRATNWPCSRARGMPPPS